MEPLFCRPLGFLPTALLVTLLAGLAASPAPAQDGTAIDAAYERWQTAQQAKVEAMKAAREAGELRKGGVPPAAVQEREAAEAEAKAALERAFTAAQDSVPRGKWLLLARVREASREYREAMGAYERYFAGRLQLVPQDATESEPSLGRAERAALNQACITALNSKQPEVAARWMEAALRVEDAAPAGDRRPSTIRNWSYPRVLIELDRWADLEKLATELAASEDQRTRAAGKQFLFVARLNRGDAASAEKVVDEMLAAPDAYPDQQGWAVRAKLACHASRGEHAKGEELLREYLQRPPRENARDANEANSRRWLQFIAGFLGKPAPAVHVDTWVGADAEPGAEPGPEPLAASRGKVVLLDFWQPWCEPCRRAMPALVALQKAHPEDLRVLGLCRVEDYGYDVSERRAVRPIAPEDYEAHVVDFRADMALSYPLGIERSGATNRTYARLGIPTLVAVDREGIVRYMTIGAGEPGTLELAVRGLLGARGD